MTVVVPVFGRAVAAVTERSPFKVSMGQALHKVELFSYIIDVILILNFDSLAFTVSMLLFVKNHIAKASLNRST